MINNQLFSTFMNNYGLNINKNHLEKNKFHDYLSNNHTSNKTTEKNTDLLHAQILDQTPNRLTSIPDFLKTRTNPNFLYDNIIHPHDINNPNPLNRKNSIEKNLHLPANNSIEKKINPPSKTPRLNNKFSKDYKPDKKNNSNFSFYLKDLKCQLHSEYNENIVLESCYINDITHPSYLTNKPEIKSISEYTRLCHQCLCSARNSQGQKVKSILFNTIISNHKDFIKKEIISNKNKSENNIIPQDVLECIKYLDHDIHALKEEIGELADTFYNDIIYRIDNLDYQTNEMTEIKKIINSIKFDDNGELILNQIGDLPEQKDKCIKLAEFLITNNLQFKYNLKGITDRLKSNINKFVMLRNKIGENFANIIKFLLGDFYNYCFYAEKIPVDNNFKTKIKIEHFGSVSDDNIKKINEKYKELISQKDKDIIYYKTLFEQNKIKYENVTHQNDILLNNLKGQGNKSDNHLNYHWLVEDNINLNKNNDILINALIKNLKIIEFFKSGFYDLKNRIDMYNNSNNLKNLENLYGKKINSAEKCIEYVVNNDILNNYQLEIDSIKKHIKNIEEEKFYKKNPIKGNDIYNLDKEVGNMGLVKRLDTDHVKFRKEGNLTESCHRIQTLTGCQIIKDGKIFNIDDVRLNQELRGNNQRYN